MPFNIVEQQAFQQLLKIAWCGSKDQIPIRSAKVARDLVVLNYEDSNKELVKMLQSYSIVVRTSSTNKQTFTEQKSNQLCPTMSFSKKEHPNITSVDDLPIDSLIQSIINDAAKKVVDEQANPCVFCSVCQEEDDEYNNAAVEFC
jgi:hypothetical protein